MTSAEARSAGTTVAVGANPRNHAAHLCEIRLNRVAVTQTALRFIAPLTSRSPGNVRGFSRTSQKPVQLRLAVKARQERLRGLSEPRQFSRMVKRQAEVM